MTIDGMKELMESVSFLDYRFKVIADSRGSIYLQASYLEPDIITGEIERQFTRQWLLSPAMVKSEIIQTAFKCVITSAEHRVREHFTYKGARIFGPHFDVDALADICEKKRLDYRGKP